MSFLKSWFYLDHEPGHEGQEGLLMHFPPLTLVRERVGTYAYCDAKGSYPPVRGYNAGSAWCGDQGLILGGLLDYLRVNSADPVANRRPSPSPAACYITWSPTRWCNRRLISPTTRTITGADQASTGAICCTASARTPLSASRS